jgi:TPR repeat protein
MADIEKVKTPFSAEQRSQLKKWSKLAKDAELASPYARKVLYEAGAYDFIFVSRLGKLVDILKTLKESVGEAEVAELDECCFTSYGSFLRAKANEDDPQTQYERAKALYFGDFDFEEDEEQALTIIKGLANADFLPAITLLGEWKLEGLCGLDEDQEAGFNLLSKAGRLGDAEAWLKITDCLQNGIGTEESPEEAFKILKDKEGQSKELRREYGLALLEGKGTDANAQKGLKILNDAAAEGDNKARRNIAAHLMENEPNAKEVGQITSLLEAAAAEDDQWSLLMLGILYDEGEIIERDFGRALSYLERAADLGNSTALDLAGQYYLYGKGCETDDEKAFNFFNSAVELGEEPANLHLAICYFRGYGTETDYKSAFNCFREAEPYFWVSTYHLGECYRSGLGVPKDQKKAFELYLSGAEAGLTRCLFALGRAYYYGEGVSEDDEEAVKWFTLAAEKEETEAKFYLGRCHYNGIGLPEHTDLGLKLIREAAQEGCEDAEAFLFEEGYSVEADDQEDTKVKTTDGVFTLAKDPSERARDLHRKLTSGNENSGEKTAQILSFRKGSTEGIDRLMSIGEESND